MDTIKDKNEEFISHLTNEQLCDALIVAMTLVARYRRKYFNGINHSLVSLDGVVVKSYPTRYTATEFERIKCAEFLQVESILWELLSCQRLEKIKNAH